MSMKVTSAEARVLISDRSHCELQAAVLNEGVSRARTGAARPDRKHVVHRAS
jgi:hypothetical protein